MRLIVIGLIAALVIGGCGFPYFTQDYVKFTVMDKERITTSDSSKYLVFTENEVFENTDCLRLFKFNSSDVQGNLNIGKKYSAEVYGWRIPFLSMYRNIITAKQQ